MCVLFFSTLRAFAKTPLGLTVAFLYRKKG